MAQIDPLDALLQEALAEASKKKVKPVPTGNKDSIKGRLDQLKESFRTMFTNPDRWLPGAAIALIHKAPNGHQTLLGAFREFNHKSSTARKLCPCSGPTLIEKEEYVTGDWWLHDRVRKVIENKEHWTVHKLRFDVELTALQVFAKSVALEVRCKEAWIAEVRLAEQTTFASPEGKQFIYFPAYLDILDGMSFANKVALQDVLHKGDNQQELPL